MASLNGILLYLYQHSLCAGFAASSVSAILSARPFVKPCLIQAKSCYLIIIIIKVAKILTGCS